MQLRAAQKFDRPFITATSGSARNVFAEKEYLFGRAVPAAISVAVEITTRRPLQIAGSRYASVFPVPVPASTMAWWARFKRVVHQLRHLQLRRPVLVVGCDRRPVKPAPHAFFEESVRPKTSRIESFAGSATCSSTASSGTLRPAVGRPRSAYIFARRLSRRALRPFPKVPSPILPRVLPKTAFFLARPARGTSNDKHTRYPSFVLALASPRNCILPDFRHLAVEHPASVLPQPSFLAPRYIQCRDSERFPFQRWQTQTSLGWGA